MKPKAVIFGAGIIGSEANRQFRREGYEIVALVSSKKLVRADGTEAVFKERGNPNEVLQHILALSGGHVDLAVFALPSAGKNVVEIEHSYVKPFLEKRTPMTLAGKALLSSDHYYELEPHLDHVDINATVGAAVCMLDEMIEHLRFDNGRDILVEAVVNGTLSYIMSGIWGNRPLEALIREAVNNKFAEPGVNNEIPDPFTVMDGEATGDVPKKLLIILRRVFGKYIGRKIKANDIEVVKFTEDAMYRFTASNERRKYVVRISTKRLPHMLERNSPGSVWADIDGKVFISGGFCQIPAGSAMDKWVPNSGPGNAVRIVQTGLPRIVIAEGAGDLATVGTLIKGARRLRSFTTRTQVHGGPYQKEFLGALAPGGQ
jgi:homoserine dehydrogenase